MYAPSSGRAGERHHATGCASRSLMEVLSTWQRRISPTCAAATPSAGSPMKTTGSMSGASHCVRPYSCPSSVTPSMSTSISCPTSDLANWMPMSCCTDTSSSRRASRTSSSTWSGYSAAGVPSSSEYTKAPMRSKRKPRTKSTSPACCSSLSPGKPLMKVVRSTRPGMRSRSFCSRFSVCARGGRFMPSSTRLSMCCSGMSMYLHTLGLFAISSMRDSVK
mmetsp:Transcript_4375/g.10938  ORF Transcript_4375/g.10938 Transcript_4375/m.10938 type:complete len:220 (+) Transcript_4375:192-851(+)